MKFALLPPYVARILSATLIVAVLASIPILHNAAAAQRTSLEQSAQRSAMEEPKVDGCVANLPFARGAVFCCLDEYLAHLQAQGAIDLPWWREISPGVYERVTRMTGAAREVASRDELLRRFGFSC